jgi:hypothetical protein
MKLGNILSFLSPAYGMATGHGIGKIMPYLSPGFGMLAGKGPFGGQHGGGDQQGQMPQMPMPGAMGDVSSPMQPMQTGAPTAPTFPTGMFGAGADPRQEMLKKYQQWQMINGGGY